MTISAFPEEQEANARAAMLLCCRLEEEPSAAPLSPPEYHAAIAALDHHGLPAVALEYSSREAVEALQHGGGFDDKQIRRITTLTKRKIALECSRAEWKIRGMNTIAHCQDQYPAKLRKLNADAPPVIHLADNPQLAEAERHLTRPVLTQWTMSPRAECLIANVAAEIIELEMTLVVSTAHQAGRKLLDAQITQGGSAMAIVDGTPLQEMIKSSEIQRQLDDDCLLLISTHDPNVRVWSTQHRCKRLVLALGGPRVDRRTGRLPRATTQNGVHAH